MVRRLEAKHTKCVSPDVLIDRDHIEMLGGIGSIRIGAGAIKAIALNKARPSVTVTSCDRTSPIAAPD